MSNILKERATEATRPKIEIVKSSLGKNLDTDRYKKYEIFVDMNRANKTFYDKYGHLTAPIVVKDTTVKEGFSVDAENDVWFHRNDFQSFLKSSSTFYPHEAVRDNLHEAMEKELKDTGLKIVKEIKAHKGRTMYWNLLSEESYLIDGEKDRVKVGVTVRNGIGTNVALGVDLYTMRLICTNGAVARGSNLGSFSIAHNMKDADKMTKRFSSQIVLAFANVKELLEVYKKSTKIIVNNKIANEMYKKLVYAGKYLPKYWELKPRKEIDTILASKKFQTTDNLVKVAEERTLWNTFNDITEQQKFGLNYNKVSFPLVALHQTKLHQAMISVVNKYSPTAPVKRSS